MTTVGLADTFTYTTFELVSCLVAPSACAYGSQVRFHPLRIPAPLVLHALNPRDGSSSSSLTSADVSLLTAPRPEKRKVGGSIPPLATTRSCLPRAFSTARMHISTLWATVYPTFIRSHN